MIRSLLLAVLVLSPMLASPPPEVAQVRPVVMSACQVQSSDISLAWLLANNYELDCWGNWIQKPHRSVACPVFYGPPNPP